MGFVHRQKGRSIMKNIVRVLRFDRERPRLYCLPENVHMVSGTVVSVEGAFGEVATGVAVSDSYVVDGQDEKMIADLFHIFPAVWDSMKRVVSVYSENKLDYSV